MYYVSVEVSKSNLSAEAKEWYPPNYVPQAPVSYTPDDSQYRVQKFSVQNRLRQAQEQNPYNLNEMAQYLDEAENMDLRVCMASFLSFQNYCKSNPDNVLLTMLLATSLEF